MDKQTPTQTKQEMRDSIYCEMSELAIALIKEDEQNRIIEIIKTHLSELEFYNIDDKFFEKDYSEEELLWKVAEDLIKIIKEHK